MTKYRELYQIIWEEIENNGVFERDLDYFWRWFKGHSISKIQTRLSCTINDIVNRPMDVNISSTGWERTQAGVNKRSRITITKR